MPVSETGPYLAMAVLCERAIREVDGVISLVRITDKVTCTLVGPVMPDPLPALPEVSLSLVIMLRAGEARRGPYVIRVRPEPPSGEPIAETELSVNFKDPPEIGANFIINLTMAVNQEGVYWITVLLNDDLLTRIPLQVEYDLQQAEAPAELQEAPPSQET